MSNVQIYSSLEHNPDSRYGNDGLQIAEDNTNKEVASPRVGYDIPVQYKDNDSQKTAERKGGGTISLLWLVIACLAFLIGGGLGGGIAAGVHSSRKNNNDLTSSCAEVNSPILTPTGNSALSPTPAPTPTAALNSIQTVTVTSTATQIVTVDVAGCPLSNGTTATSSVSSTNDTYLILCNTDITPGKDLYKGVLTGTLHDCLDICTTYSKSTTAVTENGLCLGVTWVMRYLPDMSRNGLCYMKGSRVTNVTPAGQGVAAILQ
ncbi:hypothetical protein ACMFMG_008686 [Clarireedia jacksonii]